MADRGELNGFAPCAALGLAPGRGGRRDSRRSLAQCHARDVHAQTSGKTGGERGRGKQPSGTFVPATSSSTPIFAPHEADDVRRAAGGHARAYLHVLGPADARRDRVLRHPQSRCVPRGRPSPPARGPRGQDGRRRDLDASRSRRGSGRSPSRSCMPRRGWRSSSTKRFTPIAIRPSAASVRFGIPRGWPKWATIWKEGDTAVRADPREIEFLRNNPPKSLAEPLSPAQVTGDCWQNYASRWALCHFLASNPNYSRQFRQLGRGFLAGKDVSFEQTYARDDPAVVLRVSASSSSTSAGATAWTCVPGTGRRSSPACDPDEP